MPKMKNASQKWDVCFVLHLCFLEIIPPPYFHLLKIDSLLT